MCLVSGFQPRNECSFPMFHGFRISEFICEPFHIIIQDDSILVDAFRRLTVGPADIHNSFHNILASDKTGIPVINYPRGFIFAELRVAAEIITGVSVGHLMNPDCPCNDIQDGRFP